MKYETGGAVVARMTQNRLRGLLVISEIALAWVASSVPACFFALQKPSNFQSRVRVAELVQMNFDLGALRYDDDHARVLPRRHTSAPRTVPEW